MLPLQESLQPNQDTKTGEIETWPAYASRSVSDTGKITSSFNKDIAVVKVSLYFIGFPSQNVLLVITLSLYLKIINSVLFGEQEV